jgi:hypothetical protein
LTYKWICNSLWHYSIDQINRKRIWILVRADNCNGDLSATFNRVILVKWVGLCYPTIQSRNEPILLSRDQITFVLFESKWNTYISTWKNTTFLHTILNTKCRKQFYPPQTVSIDKIMVKTKLKFSKYKIRKIQRSQFIIKSK